MAQTKQKYQIIQKVSADDTLLLYPETESEIVIYDNKLSRLTATNMKDAIDEIVDKINNFKGGVTGIKGEAETSYRSGNVNLTATDIGAEDLGAVDKHNLSVVAHEDIRASVEEAKTKADTAYAIAEGRAKAVTFATADAMKKALAKASKNEYKIGDNIFILEENTPDYWISAVLDSNNGEFGFFEVCNLETQKVDLSGYQPKVDATLNTTSKSITGALNEIKEKNDVMLINIDVNSTNISNIVDGTTKVAKSSIADTAKASNTATTWANSRNIGVKINSGVKSNGTTITANAEQSIDGSADKVIEVTLGDSGIATGTYSAVQVNSKGIAVAGGQMIEIGITGQEMPSATLALGGLFFKAIG